MKWSRTAIRYELNRASVGALFRLWLRCFLLWILVWAASDVLIVWYWTGRISGPGAHEYFGRWILAWFFTQKIPLYFLTLLQGRPGHHRQHVRLPQLAFLSEPGLRRLVCSLQSLGGPTTDGAPDRRRLHAHARSRRRGRREASSRTESDPTATAITRASPHRLTSGPPRSGTGRSANPEVDGDPLAAPPNPGARRDCHRGRSRVRVRRRVLPTRARRPDPEPGR